MGWNVILLFDDYFHAVLTDSFDGNFVSIRDVSAVNQGNEPLDILICYAGDLALVVYRQQCNLSGFIFVLYDVKRDDSCPAVLTLAFRSNGHAYLTGSTTQVGTLERILAKFLLERVVIVDQRRVFLGKALELSLQKRNIITSLT